MVRISSATVRRLSTKFMLLPRQIGIRKLAVKEKEWKSGSTTRKLSSRSRSEMMPKLPSMSAQKLPCVSIAPLGLPVVPEV